MTLGINTLLFLAGALYILHAQGCLSPIYVHRTNSFTWYQSHERHTVSNVESQVFTHHNFDSTAGNRPPDLYTTRSMRLTTQPLISALCLFRHVMTYMLYHAPFNILDNTVLLFTARHQPSTYSRNYMALFAEVIGHE